MNGWMDELVSRSGSGWVHGWEDEWMNESVIRWVGGCVGGRMDGWIEKRKSKLSCLVTKPTK